IAAPPSSAITGSLPRREIKRTQARTPLGSCGGEKTAVDSSAKQTVAVERTRAVLADARPRSKAMSKWKHDGVRVIPGNSLDSNTAQTPGMDRKAAINYARVGAQK